MKKYSRVFVCVALLIIGFRVLAAESGWLNLQQTMGVQQFKAAGLEKLDQSELAVLELWIADYARVPGRSGASVPSAPSRVPRRTDGAPLSPSRIQGASPTVIESQIDGDFEGWDGDTIFKLMNGQIWQQSSYAYSYHYSFMPDVLIYPSGGGYQMRVEGMSDAVAVRRLR